MFNVLEIEDESAEEQVGKDIEKVLSNCLAEYLESSLKVKSPVKSIFKSKNVKQAAKKLKFRLSIEEIQHISSDEETV